MGKKVLFVILGIIALMLVLDRGDAFVKIASELGGLGLKGAALLQGRQTVQGVTS